ncbi:hypothetical protein H6G89_31880 [Oscillatoria sp. FACHB-1407]|uniref:hypothetical protein n=1 Tax=Oscillatoria sp. FACHB-1407 TaxID=2692847 RepID=UPI0016823FF6|nr:hypothetical protein [Oscillatoria sp. FACHB-1407]MBD2465595.1 hypothetical protein [Oscillatoria sp. FACHB-1407]
MIATCPNAPIALEIVIPEPLFRRMQQTLDSQPTESIDALASKAIAAYLAHLQR